MRLLYIHFHIDVQVEYIIYIVYEWRGINKKKHSTTFSSGFLRLRGNLYSICPEYMYNLQLI